MASINQWEKHLNTFTTEELEEIRYAMKVLQKRWSFFTTEFQGFSNLLALVNAAYINRILKES